MAKSLSEEKHPWLIQVYVGLPLTISIRICKLWYDEDECKFISNSGEKWSVNDVDLSQSISVFKSVPIQYSIIASSLDEGINEMYRQNIELKQYLISTMLEVKNIIGRTDNDKIYTDSRVWDSYSYSILSMLNYFGVYRRTMDGRVKYILFAPVCVKKYLKYGFKKLIEVIDANVESCIEKARTIEKNLESGILNHSNIGSLEAYNNVTVHNSLDKQSNPVFKYMGNGIKPDFEIIRCE